MIADRLALEARIEDAEREAFWDEFEGRFGEPGRDPASYYTYEVGHILSLGPTEMGPLTPGDLIGAARLFDHKYRDG